MVVQSNVAALLMWAGDCTHIYSPCGILVSGHCQKVHKELTNDHIWTTALQELTVHAAELG